VKLRERYLIATPERNALPILSEGTDNQSHSQVASEGSIAIHFQMSEADRELPHSNAGEECVTNPFRQIDTYKKYIV